MGAYIVRRVIAMVLMIIVMSMIVFLLFAALPADPARPIRDCATPSPTATIVPQQSAPWIRGSRSGDPVQAASAACPVSPASPLALLTALEYQPVRVLMSVLLTPAA
jgi:hypothetical protein